MTAIDPDAPSDAQRYPDLPAHGRAMLDFLREHPHAPLYRNQSGHRLTPQDLAAVRAHEREVEAAGPAYAGSARPPWLDAFVARCFEQVPFHRALGSAPRDFEALGTTDRGDLSRDIAQHVPDDVPIERLILFSTSGTTGQHLLLASHPVVAASYLAYHKRALQRFGIALHHARGQVGVVLIGMQKVCFTYVSVTPSMDCSGLAKLNLHLHDWRAPEDRERYLDALAPEVIAGDPLSFAELLRIPTRCPPRALLCTSMALGAGLRRALEARFGCPLLDLYSMNEAGPIAVYDARCGGHVLLQPGLYVELLDGRGRPVPAGARGEITLTGGFNSWLPLLRYRTGDHASLQYVGSEPVLVELEGRPPVSFRTTGHAFINNIDVTHALARFELVQYTVHQGGSGELQLRCADRHVDEAGIVAALRGLLGADQAISIATGCVFEGKVIQYTSELSPP